MTAPLCFVFCPVCCDPPETPQGRSLTQSPAKRVCVGKAAHRVVAPYGCHSPRGTGGSGDPPLRGNFGPAWYGGRCSHETSSVSPEPNEAPNTPQGRVPDSAHPPFMGTASSGAPRSRTLCHGWSEPGAAVKWHRPEFCTASGPSGPEGIKTGNRILCAGTSAERCRGIPRKRGSGGGSAGAVRRPRDSPGDPLVSFPSLGKKLAPKGENL